MNMPICEATILVVDDEPAIRRMLGLLLKQRGYTVIEAASGEEALKICERDGGTIQLVITDVIMPGVGGFELAAKLRPIRPSLKILFISGWIGPQEMPPNIHGAFQQKPFRPSDLLTKVNLLLST